MGLLSSNDIIIIPSFYYPDPRRADFVHLFPPPQEELILYKVNCCYELRRKLREKPENKAMQ